MNDIIKAKIKEHALRVFPEECCGYVCINQAGEINVLESQNIAHNKVGRFTIEPKKYREAEKFGHIVAFYHSHASEFLKEENNRFSKEDLDAAYEAALPALLYVTPQDTWHFHTPSTYQAPDLLGRPFVIGVWDCYSIVRDYYRKKYGITIGYHFPPENFNYRTNQEFEKHMAEEPFYEIPLEEVREGDVLMFRMHSEYINHVAIYLGNNEILHQFRGLSCTKPLDEKDMRSFAKALRLKR